MVQVGYNYAPQWEEEPAIVSPRPERRVKKITRRKLNCSRQRLGKIGAVLFLYGIFLVYLCIKSATLGYEIVQLEKEVSGLQTSNERIEYRIAQVTSLENVEQVALSELHMYKPESNINVAVSDTYYSSSQDKLNTPSTSEEMYSAGIDRNALGKLYASLMQLAYNN